MDAAQAWVTKENTDALVKFLGDVPTAGKQRDGRVVAKISKLLIAIGPSVEEKVIPLLKSTDFVVRSQACWILTEVGTAKSIEPLQEAARVYAGVDANFFNQTQFAMQRIKARN